MVVPLFKLHLRCDAGWSSLVARRAHNPKVVGSNPAPATTYILFFLWGICPFFIYKMNKDDIENIVKPVINRHECYLWGIEILRGRKRPTLRVYIESDAGAGIDDCELVAKDLNYEAELESILGDDFILEVSTPGIDRRFFYYEQLKEYVGEEFKIKLREPLDGVKNINGYLAECKDDFLKIETSNLEYKLEFNEIEFCKLEPNFEKIMKESEHAK